MSLVAQSSRTRLEPAEVRRLVDEINASGAQAVARALGVSRQTALGAAAGLQLRRDVAERIRAKLDATKPANDTRGEP